MNSTDVEKMVKTAPVGYSFCKLIQNDDGKAVDFEFIQVNEAFEELSGLKGSEIVNRRATEVIEGIDEAGFDFLGMYGEVATHGLMREYRQHAPHLNKWFKAIVYSPEMGFFTSLFVDISDEVNALTSLKQEMSLEKGCLETRINELHQHYENQRNISQELSLKVEEQNSANKECLRSMDTLQKEKEKLQNKIDKSNILQQENQQKNNDLQAENEELKQNCSKLEKDLTDLDKKHATLNEYSESMAEKAVILKYMQKSADSGYWTYDHSDGTLYWSDHLYIIFNREKDNFEPSRDYFMKAVHPDDRNKVEDAWREIIEKHGEYSIQYRLKTSDDIVRWVSEYCRTELSKSGDSLLVTGYVQDITELKKVSEKLDVTSKKYQNISNLTKDMIFEVDSDWKFTSLSPKCEQILGLPPEKLTGKSIFEFILMEDQEGIRDLFEQSFESANVLSDKEYRFRGMDEKVKTASVSAVVMKDSEGQAFGMIGVLKDITSVKELMLENKNFKEQAEAADQANADFLSNISHEIQMPLQGVISFTELLGNTNMSPEQKQFADNANSSAQALQGIINDIFDFSKIEEGKLELEESEIDLYELIEQTATIINQETSRKGLELLVNIQPDMPQYVTLDPMRIKQILINLLSNAVKFTESGEIELSAGFSEIQGQTDVGSFSFSVRDTGIGISEKNQKRLFKAFTQEKVSTSKKYGGTGLGLVISNKIAEKMGSSLSVISDENKGSLFDFSVDRKFRSVDSLKPDKASSLRQILIVDDNENNRQIISLKLKSWNIQSVEVGDALSAMQMLEAENCFDAMLIDFNMPYIDGFETLRIIREKLKITEKSLPVLLMHNSSDDPSQLEKCEALGVRCLLTKPVKSGRLLSCLEGIASERIKAGLLKESEPEKTENDHRVSQMLAAPSEIVKSDFSHEHMDIEPVQCDNKSLYILVAEDVPLNMVLIRSMINKLCPDAEIIEAVNGSQAVEKALAVKPGLILMDIQMPVMDGLKATAMLKKEHDIPVIALSAGVVKGEKDKCLEAGMDDFLVKPLDMELLKEKLERYLINTDKIIKDKVE